MPWLSQMRPNSGEFTKSTKMAYLSPPYVVFSSFTQYVRPAGVGLRPSRALHSTVTKSLSFRLRRSISSLKMCLLFKIYFETYDGGVFVETDLTFSKASSNDSPSFNSLAISSAHC